MVLIKYFCIGCILCGLLFLQGSFDLINFDRNWFLKDIDFCKPGVIQGLFLNFNLFLEIFLEVHMCQVKTQTFQGKVFSFQFLCHSTEKKSSTRFS